MASIQYFKCTSCDVEFSNFIGGRRETMVRDWSGYSTVQCGGCLKKVKVKLYDESVQVQDKPKPSRLKRLFYRLAGIFRRSEEVYPSDLEIYQSLKLTCPECHSDKLLGITCFDCPKCGGAIEEDRDSIVMV